MDFIFSANTPVLEFLDIQNMFPKSIKFIWRKIYLLPCRWKIQCVKTMRTFPLIKSVNKVPRFHKNVDFEKKILDSVEFSSMLAISNWSDKQCLHKLGTETLKRNLVLNLFLGMYFNSFLLSLEAIKNLVQSLFTDPFCPIFFLEAR